MDVNNELSLLDLLPTVSLIYVFLDTVAVVD